MRQLVSFAVFIYAVSFSVGFAATTPSYSDAASSLLTKQQACQLADKSYDPSCIKKLSADYVALYQAAAAVTSQIDPNNPLVDLAKDQTKQYQQVQNFIHDNALALMNGTTFVNPDWLKPPSGTSSNPLAAIAGAGNSGNAVPPPAPSTNACAVQVATGLKQPTRPIPDTYTVNCAGGAVPTKVCNSGHTRSSGSRKRNRRCIRPRANIRKVRLRPVAIHIC